MQTAEGLFAWEFSDRLLGGQRLLRKAFRRETYQTPELYLGIRQWVVVGVNHVLRKHIRASGACPTPGSLQPTMRETAVLETRLKIKGL